MAGWIKMPVGMEVGLGPGNFVFDGDPAPLLQKGTEPPIFCLLWRNGWIDHYGAWHGGGLWPRPHCARYGDPAPSPKGGRAIPFSAHFYCDQTAG